MQTQYAKRSKAVRLPKHQQTMTSNPHLREDNAPHEGMSAVLLELAQQLVGARERYDALVEWRSANAATTELASDHRLNHKPFYYERNGWRPGKLLKGQP